MTTVFCLTLMCLACLQVLFCKLSKEQRDIYRSYLSSKEVEEIVQGVCLQPATAHRHAAYSCVSCVALSAVPHQASVLGAGLAEIHAPSLMADRCRRLHDPARRPAPSMLAQCAQDWSAQQAVTTCP